MDNVREAPTSCGWAHRMALLVIDVQQGLFDRQDPVHDGAHLLDTLNVLITRAREAGTAVVYAQHANKTTLVRDSAAWRLHGDLLAPQTTETVIHKIHGDAFEETGLQGLLTERGIDTLVITGLVTQGCIRTTCKGALARGYRVVLVRDGHSTVGRHAVATIATWNEKLGEEGADLRDAAELDFCSTAPDGTSDAVRPRDHALCSRSIGT